MSATHYHTLNQLYALIEQLGMAYSDVAQWTQEADQQVRELRIFNRGETLFQGTLDRCSDFLRGYALGKAES